MIDTTFLDALTLPAVASWEADSAWGRDAMLVRFHLDVQQDAFATGGDEGQPGRYLIAVYELDSGEAVEMRLHPDTKQVRIVGHCPEPCGYEYEGPENLASRRQVENLWRHWKQNGFPCALCEFTALVDAE